MRTRVGTKSNESSFVVGARVKHVITDIYNVVTQSKEGVIISRIGNSLQIKWNNSDIHEGWAW